MVINFFKDLFSFKGRMNRTKYIFYSILTLFTTAISSIFALVSYSDSSFEDIGFLLLLLVLFIVVMYIAIVVMVKRLKDINKSVWWVLLSFIPITAIILDLVLIFKKGTNEVNRYGDKPLEKKSNTAMIISSVVLTIIMLLCGVLFTSEMINLDDSVEIVKQTIHPETNETIEKYIENKIEKLDPYFVDDWYSENVEGNTYFVSFDFDKDDDIENGYSCYPYEINLDTNEVKEISSKDMINKYKSLGYFYGSLVTNEFEYEQNNK